MKLDEQAPFFYQSIFENIVPDNTGYYKLEEASKFVSAFSMPDGTTAIKVEPKALEMLSAVAMRDISHLLRSRHLQQLSKILDDPEASENDRFVAMQLLKNAVIASSGIFPSCQDTGTAIIMGKRGQFVFTNGDDESALSKGVYDTYTRSNLRYSQVSPLDMFREINTRTNLPAQVDIYATKGDEYHFQFMAKGGGSANKTYLYQMTKALLNPTNFEKFVKEKMLSIGTAACPPYHLAFVVGGLSAEQNLKTVKLASSGYLDNLPISGNEHGRAFRDKDMEEMVLTAQ